MTATPIDLDELEKFLGKKGWRDSYTIELVRALPALIAIARKAEQAEAKGRRDMAQEAYNAVCPFCAQGDVPAEQAEPFIGLYHRNYKKRGDPDLIFDKCTAEAIYALADKEPQP